jgi:hypothetical protein
MRSRSSVIDKPTRGRKVTTVEIIRFAVLVLWVPFAAALLFSQSSIHEIWAGFKAQSLIVQPPLGVLFLPWLIGMWIWKSSCPSPQRGVLVGGLAWANVYAFFPWKPIG